MILNRYVPGVEIVGWRDLLFSEAIVPNLGCNMLDDNVFRNVFFVCFDNIDDFLEKTQM